MGIFERVKAMIVPDFSDLPRPDPGPTSGRPGRARVLQTWGEDTHDGWRTTHTSRWVHKELELQLLDDPQQRAKVKCWFSMEDFGTTTVGRELPVRLHEQTGVILGVDYDGWEREAAAIRAAGPAPPSGGPLVTS